MTTEALDHILRQAEFANKPGPRLAGTSHGFPDDIQYKLWGSFHSLGQSLEVRFID